MDKNSDWQISKTSLSERFRELYKLSEWTDCAFSVGEINNEVIRCHKLVLVTSSPVFEALFFGPLADNNKEIFVPDVEPSTFYSLLRYLYCDTVEFDSILEAGYLLYASKKYMIPHLSRICLDYIVQHMQITNLWDVLDVAECLNEEELLDTCLKIMRQYSIDVWSSSNDHLSQTTLCRLLDQNATNITETELWTFIISWAETECREKNIEVNAKNIRYILDNNDLLYKIRFLTFSTNDLIKLVKPTGIITCSELVTLQNCVEIINHHCNESCDINCDKNLNKNSSDQSFIVPKGFSGCYRKRERISTFINHCPRQILTKRKTWTYGGTVCTKVTSQIHVLVTGFEVFTRIPSTADFCMSRGNAGHYNERLVVKISDDQENELNKTDHNDIAEFNASQNVKLSQPVWFHPQRKYSVTFELPSGQYPLSQLSGAASNKMAVFRFEEYTNYPEGYLDFSFISAVMFSL